MEKLKPRKIYIVNYCSKKIYNKEFSNKKEPEEFIIEARLSNCHRFASGQKLKKVRDWKIEDFNEIKQIRDRRVLEESNRIKDLKERGLFYK
jgi:hypothetical protein